MKDLFYYWDKKVRIIDIDNKAFWGPVDDVISADDNDEKIASIVIRSAIGSPYAGKLVEFFENEIKSIEIIKD